MSGGFFRGTSADQDTRFSNKQAKLLKSQKFPPELDHVVDITKVKMDVIRPWIATRATELLGFEDEVLINFIYGLLEGKPGKGVDGKQIQIQLTGFMEKNTGKFMKELWGLLLSAQSNASGIPQQFLDAKEEEMKKKQVESDRITQEIQRRKEKGGWESEQDRKNRMDGKVDVVGPTFSTRNDNHAIEVAEKLSLAKASGTNLEDEVDVEGKHSSRRKSSPSPPRITDSPRRSRKTPSASRSRSMSHSNSRSHSRERDSPRSISGSPRRMRWSNSPRRHYRSPSRHSISPRGMPRSPRLRQSSRSRKRSVSRSRNISPSPARRRYPQRGRSPSPLHWRSSPSRRQRTPLRHRSPTPQRHRSPRRRSPVNLYRVSPSQRRFPYRHRTPQRHASRSPLRRSPPRSPKYLKRSPVRSPRRSRNSPPLRDRSQSLSRSQSPSNRCHRKLSKDRDCHSNGVTLRKHHADFGSQRSPAHAFCDGGEPRKAASVHKESSPALRQSISLRSPQRHSHVDKEKGPALSTVIERGSLDDIEIKAKEKSIKGHAKQYEDKLSVPIRSEKSNREVDDTADIRKRKYSPNVARSKGILDKFPYFEEKSHERPAVDRYADSRSARGHMHDNVTSHNGLSEKRRESSPHLAEEVEYGPGRLAEYPTGHFEEDRLSGKSNVILKESYQFDNKKPRHYKDDDSGSLHQSQNKIKRDAEHENTESPVKSDSEDDTRHKHRNTHKNFRRPDKDETLSDEDGSSPKDDLKEAKRRRKEDKRLRKEEKRRKREERHRRREERRAEKLKAKCLDRASPSDHERGLSGDDSDVHAAIKKAASPNNREDTELEQRRLEIQLREKALESLRAKKAATH